VIYDLPDGVSCGCAKADRNRAVGHRQAARRPGGSGNPQFRPPEPYKGKGIKYAEEYIFRKEGKNK
jgi:large subunit ribosomal protein L6